MASAAIRRNSRWGGVAQIVIGLGILALCLTAQISSVLTPSLARYPVLLHGFASGGVLLLMLAAIVSFLTVLRSRRRQLYPLSFTYLCLAAFAQLNVWGQVFQLSLAGLTVGGGLVVLGGIRALPTNQKTA